MEWMLSQLSVPANYLERGFWTLVGSIIAAIGWGFRVEMKLAKLDRDQIAANEASNAIKSDVKELRNFTDDARVHMARVDERLVKIIEAIERNNR